MFYDNAEPSLSTSSRVSGKMKTNLISCFTCFYYVIWCHVVRVLSLGRIENIENV